MGKRKRVKPRSKPRRVKVRVRSRPQKKSAPLKRSHHKQPKKKLSRAAKREKREKKLRSQITQLQSDLRMRDHAIRELTMTQRVSFPKEPDDEGDDEPDTPGFEGRVPGSEIVRDDEGEIIGYSLPYILESADFDFEDEFDYDEIYDDMGDEEDDTAYGENET